MLARVTLTLAIMLSNAAGPGTAARGDERLHMHNMKKDVQVQLNYLLYLPAVYEEKESWPLLLFLHGAGERGNDIELVKVHGPPKLIAAGKDFPFIVVSPQCREGGWWEPVSLLALLDEMVLRHNVDKDRVYVTGLSMGGYGTWDLAAYAPERIAAIAPICGGSHPILAKEIAHLPIWAFHGAKDEVVKLERSQEMVDALRQAGGNARLTVYPEVAHDSWTESYNNPELYSWLLKQSK